MKKIVLIIGILFIFQSCINVEKSDEFLKSGNLKLDNGDNKGALNDFDEAIKLNPNNSNAYYWRAFTKHNLNDYKGAIEDCNKTLEIDPKFADAHFEKGIIKFSKLKDFEGAYKDYTIAIKYNSKNKYYYSCRATASKYLTNYNPNNIILDCTKAIELDPSEGEFYYSRGLAKFDLNLNESACLDLKKSEELGYEDATVILKEKCN